MNDSSNVEPRSSVGAPAENAAGPERCSEAIGSALFEAAGRIICRPHYCTYCYERLEDAMKARARGPEAFLRAIIEGQGMVCSGVEWMLDVAHEALNAPNTKLSNSGD